MEAELVVRAAGGRRLAVRAEVGRLQGRARERRRRARALVAQGAPAPSLLPGAASARRAAPAPLRARRRDRDRPRRRARLRADADAAAPGREPRQQAGRGDPRGVHRVRRAALEGQAGPRAAAREAAQGAREGRQGLPAVAGDDRPRPGAGLARHVRGRGPRRRDRQAARPPVPPGLARRRSRRSSRTRPRTASSSACAGRRSRRTSRRCSSGCTATTARSTTSALRPSARSSTPRSSSSSSRCSKNAPERRFSEPNRWGTGDLEETALRPELVAEVRYDKVQGNRFRHGTRLIRFRDDKDPKDCTWREVRPAAQPERPDVRVAARYFFLAREG